MKPYPVWNALSHATIIGSVMFIIFFCIDRVNPAMDFLGSTLSKWCLFTYCVASLITALYSAAYLFKRGRTVSRHPVAHRQTAGEPVHREAAHTAHRTLDRERNGWNGYSVGPAINSVRR